MNLKSITIGFLLVVLAASAHATVIGEWEKVPAQGGVGTYGPPNNTIYNRWDLIVTSNQGSISTIELWAHDDFMNEILGYNPETWMNDLPQVFATGDFPTGDTCFTYSASAVQVGVQGEVGTTDIYAAFT
ncbi:MAG: hypothetical protein JXA11_02965, partial [Phycisphaerae bacterium]|nr:hypothetical protein [Phycisphaerae bacterium]